MFDDRKDAARRLMAALPDLDGADTVVLALPRGGVPVAEPIARRLDAPLDLVLVRKVGAPGHEEYAVGAVTDAGGLHVTVNPEAARVFGLDEAGVRRLAERELPELRRRRERYMAGRAPEPLAGRTVLLVDDGIATGSTVRAALRTIRQAGPERVILAVPVAPRDVVESLRDEADEVICLEMPEPFRAVGAHYRRFDQVDDSEVLALLGRA